MLGIMGMIRFQFSKLRTIQAILIAPVLTLGLFAAVACSRSTAFRTLGDLTFPVGKATIVVTAKIGKPVIAKSVPANTGACSLSSPGTTNVAIPGELDFLLHGATTAMTIHPTVGVSSAGSSGLYVASDKGSTQGIVQQSTLSVDNKWQCDGPFEQSTAVLSPNKMLTVPIWLFAYNVPVKGDVAREVNDWVLVVGAIRTDAADAGAEGGRASATGPSAVHCTGSDGEDGFGLLLYGHDTVTRTSQQLDFSEETFRCVTVK
jgi:hypothetical protein